MTVRSTLVVLALALAASPAGAQNRAELQTLLELRALQSQVQQLRLAVNTLAEQLKKTDGRLDAVTNDTLKGFADQKLLIDAIGATLGSLSERESSASLEIRKLNQEMKTIRSGLEQQQTTLNQIVTLLQQVATAGAVDPAVLATLPKEPGSVPPSVSEYYQSARKYYYEGNFDFAIGALEDAIKKYPDAAQAVEAQLMIGDSYDQLNKSQEAIAAFALAIKTYKDSDFVPEAFLKMGQVYEKIAQKDEAVKNYQQARKMAAPGSSTAALAEQHLKRLGIIKDL
jgi:TolA-binding protein